MNGPVCPHCGDLARGCACPPEPYVGELSADVIYPCWISDIDRANSAEHERDRLATVESALCDQIRHLKAELHAEKEANRPLRLAAGQRGEMHRRAQKAEGELATMRGKLEAEEADNRRLRLELGLALADRQRAEYERDKANEGKYELYWRLKRYDNTVCWNVQCAHEAEALDAKVTLHEMREELERLVAPGAHDTVEGMRAALTKVLAMKMVPSRAPEDRRCKECGLGVAPGEACRWCAMGGPSTP